MKQIRRFAGIFILLLMGFTAEQGITGENPQLADGLYAKFLPDDYDVCARTGNFCSTMFPATYVRRCVSIISFVNLQNISLISRLDSLVSPITENVFFVNQFGSYSAINSTLPQYLCFSVACIASS